MKINTNYTPTNEGDLEKISKSKSIEKNYTLINVNLNDKEVIPALSGREDIAVGLKIPFIGPQEFDDSIESSLREVVGNNKIYSLCFVGLDLTSKVQENIQIKTVKKLLSIANEFDLPVIVSCVGAGSYSKFFGILKETNLKIKGEIVYNKYFRECDELNDSGLLISFDLDSLNNSLVREIFTKSRQKRILLHSKDYNLKNEEFFIEGAKLRKISKEDLRRILNFNAIKLFNFPIPLKDKYVYIIRNKAYINLTNRCTNNCQFCPRIYDPVVKGHYLKIKEEPTSDQIINQLGNINDYEEIVFCGYGEPTIKMNVIQEVAEYVKEKQGKTRLNTNGQLNLIKGENTVPKLGGLFDCISISLNFHNKELYQKYCKPSFGVKAFDSILDFAKESKKICPKVVLSVLEGCPEVDIDKCREIAEELGCELRLRTYYQQ